jgi:hypothetical protein
MGRIGEMMGVLLSYHLVYQGWDMDISWGKYRGYTQQVDTGTGICVKFYCTNNRHTQSAPEVLDEGKEHIV